VQGEKETFPPPPTFQFEYLYQNESPDDNVNSFVELFARFSTVQQGVPQKHFGFAPHRGREVIDHVSTKS
jgi:hypothetical protein